MKRKKQKNGISLIVLVITILVMIILAAAVTVTLFNNNIIGKANDAVEEHGEQTEKERVIFAVTESISKNNGQVKAQDIQEVLTDVSVNAEGDKIVVQFNNSKKKYVIDKSGTVTVRAASGAWKVNENGKITLTKDGNTIELAMGDKVTYNAASDKGAKLSYESKAEKNGYLNQTFTSSEYTGSWYVFGEEDGNLILISDVITPDDLEYYGLRGATGYINSEEEFQNIADIYGQGDNAILARCINLEDINNITNYPIEKQNEGSVYAYGNIVTFKRQGYTVTYSSVKPNGEYVGSGNAEDLSDTTPFKYIKDGTVLVLNDGESVSFTSSYCSYKIADYTNEDNKKYIDILLGKGNFWIDYRYERPIGNNVIWGHMMLKDGTSAEIDRNYSMLSSAGEEFGGATNNYYYSYCGIRVLVYVDYTTLAQED